jgi:uncharacterized protein YukE
MYLHSIRKGILGKEGFMNTIDMKTEAARTHSENLRSSIDQLTSIRKSLIIHAEHLKSVWQSKSADEFQELHLPQMNILWTKIQVLIGLVNQLNAAINAAEEADQRLEGG